MKLLELVKKLSKKQKIVGGGVLLVIATIVTLFLRGTFDSYLIKYGLKSYPERPAQALDQLLKVATPSYSLKYPTGWGVDSKQNTVSVYTKETGAKDSSQSPAGVLIRPWLLAEKENAPLTEVVTLWRDKLRLSYPGIKITAEQPLTINQKEAYYFEVLYSEDKNNLSGSKNEFKARQYIIRSGKYLYQILATSFEPLWPMYKNTLTGIAESLVIPAL